MIKNSEISKYFTENDVLIVQEALSIYKGSEESRVQKAILQLAKGSIEGVKYHVECALKDYRDILYWAEYPEESEEAFINHISGMTVNERLFHLNLMDDFDTAAANKDESTIREVLIKCMLSDEDINAIIKSKINT